MNIITTLKVAKFGVGILAAGAVRSVTKNALSLVRPEGLKGFDAFKHNLGEFMIETAAISLLTKPIDKTFDSLIEAVKTAKESEEEAPSFQSLLDSAFDKLTPEEKVAVASAIEGSVVHTEAAPKDED